MSHQSLTGDLSDHFPAVEACRELAFAKVNLGLKVLSQRQDGFHDLLSLFQAVSLHDTVTVTPDRGTHRISLQCSDPELPGGPDNLAWQAAQLYQRQCAGPGCHIDLVKRIPAGAGLGGGSADAAAVLRALDRLAPEPLGLSRLADMGAQLGSDVPFAVHGGTMLVEGRGERLLPQAWCRPPAWWMVLVCPPSPVSTPWAFGELAKRRAGVRRVEMQGLSDSSPYATLLCSARGGCLDAEALWSVVDNDFQPLVEDTKPIVAHASRLLADTDPLAHSMSGTGSSVYGIYDDRIAARNAETILRAAEYPVFLCTPVPRPDTGGAQIA